MKMYYFLIRMSWTNRTILYCVKTSFINLNFQLWVSSFYDLIYEVTETNYNVILMTVGLWCIFKKSKLRHVHIHMHPNNWKIHVLQQCSAISEGTDFSIPRATNTKNVKDTKNPRKNKFQNQKSITTSAAKKTPVSDSPLQLVNAKCLVCV